MLELHRRLLPGGNNLEVAMQTPFPVCFRRNKTAFLNKLAWVTGSASFLQLLGAGADRTLVLQRGQGKGLPSYSKFPSPFLDPPSYGDLSSLPPLGLSF